MAIRRLLIVRHAHFPGNRVTAATGEAASLVSQLPPEADLEVGLDDVGRKQVPLLKHWLELHVPQIDICLTSPYERAQETAEGAVPDITPTIDDRLHERNRGKVAGMPKQLFRKRFPESARIKDEDPIGWRPEDGETLREAATQRLQAVIGDIALRSPNETCVLFTHGEMVIAGRTLPMLGNMDNEALKRGLAPGWPALEVDNCQFDEYTTINPVDTTEIADDFAWMRTINPCKDFAGSGWLPISR